MFKVVNIAYTRWYLQNGKLYFTDLLPPSNLLHLRVDTIDGFYILINEHDCDI